MGINFDYVHIILTIFINLIRCLLYTVATVAEYLSKFKIYLLINYFSSPSLAR